MRRTATIAILGSIIFGCILAFGIETKVARCGGSYAVQSTIFGLEMPALRDPFNGYCSGGRSTYYRGFVPIGSECIACPSQSLINSESSNALPIEETINPVDVLWPNLLISLLTTILGLRLWQLYIASKDLKKHLQPK